MIVELNEKYKPLPEGSEIPEGQRALETLRKSLHEIMYFHDRNEETIRRLLTDLCKAKESTSRYEKQITELKKSIDVLSI